MMNVSRPIVSVIIPIFNAEKWLDSCLKSILSQTLRDIEIICIDDGSVDGSSLIVKRYAQSDARIRFEKTNHIPTGAVRNIGIKIASGQYLAFMDADDVYPEPSTLEKLVNAAERHCVQIVGGYVICFSGDIPSAPVVRQNDLPHYPTHFGFIRYEDFQEMYGFYAYLYRRSFIIANNIKFPSLTKFEDPHFFVWAMLKAKKFYAIDECVYLYRLNHKKISRDHTFYEGQRERMSSICALMEIAVKENLPGLLRKLMYEAIGWIETRQDYNEVRAVVGRVFACLKASRLINNQDVEWIGHWIVHCEPFPIRCLYALKICLYFWQYIKLGKGTIDWICG